jgi:predicted nuclease of predicted toxin-antitoxin system
MRRGGPRQLKDPQIAPLAKKEQRVILTHDPDFGELYYFAERGEIGILVLRLHHQTFEAVNEVLGRFLKSEAPSKIDRWHSLVILSATTYHVYHGPRVDS